jgi:hypothetical protein
MQGGFHIGKATYLCCLSGRNEVQDPDNGSKKAEQLDEMMCEGKVGGGIA